MTNQGKLLTQLNPSYVKVLIAYLGWSLKPMAQNYQEIFIFLSQYCVQKYIVCKPLSPCHNETFLKTTLR